MPDGTSATLLIFCIRQAANDLRTQSDVRGALGSFPAMLLNAEVAPRSVLTAWIAGEPLPAGLSLGEECALKDPAEGGAVVRCQYQELRCDEVDKHLEAGKVVTRLALVFESNLSFVLGDDLIARKLKFLDGALDQLDRACDLAAQSSVMSPRSACGSAKRARIEMGTWRWHSGEGWGQSNLVPSIGTRPGCL